MHYSIWTKDSVRKLFLCFGNKVGGASLKQVGEFLGFFFTISVTWIKKSQVELINWPTWSDKGASTATNGLKKGHKRVSFATLVNYETAAAGWGSEGLFHPKKEVVKLLVVTRTKWAPKNGFGASKVTPSASKESLPIQSEYLEDHKDTLRYK